MAYVRREVTKMINNSIKYSRLHPVICVLFRDIRKGELYDYTEVMNKNDGGTR